MDKNTERLLQSVAQLNAGKDMGIRGQYSNRRDTNEPEIVAVLEAHGLSVERVDKPLDLIVGFSGRTYLCEVKNGPKAKLTKFQQAFFGRWRGHATILTSVQDAEDFAREVRGGK